MKANSQSAHSISFGDKRIAPPFAANDVKRIDRGISQEVRILWENGVETIESCEGGRGHSFPEPTVRFAGGQAEGFRALSIALQHGLHVAELRRYYTIIDGEPNGPHWEMTFHKKSKAG